MPAEFAVERIRWLHKRIKDGYFPNAMRLAERFGISQRQAQRDVDYLKKKLGAPLAYSMEHKGYYYTKPQRPRRYSRGNRCHRHPDHYPEA